MAVTLPNLSLLQPAVNSATDEDLWGGQLNGNMLILDNEAATATLNKDWAAFVQSDAEVKDFSETAFSKGSVSGAVTLDYTDGSYQFMTLTGNISSLTINNFPASGKAGWMTLEMIQDGTGSHTLTLGAAFEFPGGSAPVLTTTANAVDFLYIVTRDAGTTIRVTNQLDFS